MRKFYEYRTDFMSQHLPDTAIITIGKFITGSSTYRGGTTEYRNFIHIKLWFINTGFSFNTKKVTGKYY